MLGKLFRSRGRKELEVFLETVAGSEKLQATIGDLIIMHELIAIGAEYGYEFSLADLMGAAHMEPDLGGLILRHGNFWTRIIAPPLTPVD